MKLKGTLGLVAACVMLVTMQANAQAKRGTKSGLAESFEGQGYGVAGCGLGSVVFGSKPGPIQIVAATLNGTGMQTVGITFGTSNCGPGVFGGKQVEYIEINREALKTEVARGDGETINGLASLMKCGDSKVFGTELRANYESIFGSAKTAVQSTKAVFATIDESPALQATCNTTI